MDETAQYWQGYRLNPDGTIQFSAVVDYGILAVRSGAIFQFNYAGSQAEIDAGHLQSIQLHMSADNLRVCAKELLRIADQLDA